MAKPRKSTAVKKAGTSTKKARIGERGKEAASTATGKKADDIFGFMAGKVTITGDIVSPILSPEEWGSLYHSPRPSRRRR